MLKKTLKYFINKFLSLFNLQLNRITLSNDFYFYIVKTLNRFKIDTVIDIGANEGQFAQNIIKYGYKKEIISFEPIKSIHKILKKYEMFPKRTKCRNDHRKHNLSRNFPPEM